MEPDALTWELDERAQSGEALAARLGVSRVAVHKRVARMRALGYPVVSSARGYRWQEGAPAPRPLARRYRGPLLERVYYLAEVGSTQDALRAMAEAGAPEGRLVVAEAQTAGRGRRGRSWLSPRGGLYFSLLLRPRLPLAALPRVSLAAGAALARAAGVGGLKWPNDLLAPDGRKLAGILMEADLRGEEVRYLVLGVGLNFDPPPAPEGAGLAAYAPAGRAEVLARFLAELEPLYARLDDAEAVLAAWRAHDLTLGRAVRVTAPGGVVEGTAEALEPDGTLVVRTRQGRRARVGAGDVEWIGGWT